jgi:hypothetical protein
MRLLLDTHTLLWLVEGSPNLSSMTWAALAEPGMKERISHDYLVGLACIAVLGGMLFPFNRTAGVVVLVLWGVTTIICAIKHR